MELKIPESNGFYFYVLLCADKSLYGGFSTNLKHRLKQHQTYRGAKYTKVKKRHPLKMIYFEKFENKHDALSAEYKFKHQKRSDKVNYLKKNGVPLSIFV